MWAGVTCLLFGAPSSGPGSSLGPQKCPTAALLAITLYVQAPMVGAVDVDLIITACSPTEQVIVTTTTTTTSWTDDEVARRLSQFPSPSICFSVSQLELQRGDWYRHVIPGHHIDSHLTLRPFLDRRDPRSFHDWEVWFTRWRVVAVRRRDDDEPLLPGDDSWTELHSLH